MTEENIHDLYDFMAQHSNDVASEYRRIRRRVRDDPGTAGDQGEENWAELLKDWLPPGYQVVTKGQIISADGRTTPQIDVIVLKDIYPKKLLSKKHYLAGGVAAAFECKITLKACHIESAVKTCKAIKDLYPLREGTPYKELHAPIVYGLLAHSHSWNRQRSTPVKNISDKLNESDALYVTHPRQTLDLLTVADLGIWTSAKIAFAGPQNGDQSRLVRSGYVSNTEQHDIQKANFTPIGSLVSLLIQKLAREDVRLRDLADYYRLVGLWGSGEGLMRAWPASVFSQFVHSQILAGRLTGNDIWNEWNVGFF